MARVGLYRGSVTSYRGLDGAFMPILDTSTLVDFSMNEKKPLDLPLHFPILDLSTFTSFVMRAFACAMAASRVAG